MEVHINGDDGMTPEDGVLLRDLLDRAMKRVGANKLKATSLGTADAGTTRVGGVRSAQERAEQAADRKQGTR